MPSTLPALVACYQPRADHAEANGPDEAVRTIARTLSHELAQPLTVLIGLLDLWDRGYFADAADACLRAELGEVAHELAARVRAFTRAERYVTREFAGDRLLDLPRAQTAAGRWAPLERPRGGDPAGLRRCRRE